MFNKHTKKDEYRYREKKPITSETNDYKSKVFNSHHYAMPMLLLQGYQILLDKAEYKRKTTQTNYKKKKILKIPI